MRKKFYPEWAGQENGEGVVTVGNSRSGPPEEAVSILFREWKREMECCSGWRGKGMGLKDAYAESGVRR